MCGIVGQLNFNGRSVNENVIRAMTKALSHRGPDDEGVFTDGPVGLGHRRLSIIDLSSRGHQPMSDAEGKIWITYNGEIYNFPELKNGLEKKGYKFSSKTDTEVIIHLYKEYGTGCLPRLRGMFAFAIWDANKRELFLARDRVGKKPLKYYSNGQTFIFASELKAILKNPAVKKEPDWTAIDEFLTFKYVPCPRTGFLGIRKLPPAHYLIVKENGEEMLRPYWDIDFSGKLELSEADWMEKIKAALIEAVGARLISDVPLGAFLSGGIDSSLITAIMARDLGLKVKTFSIGFAEGPNELAYAKMVADKYRTEHHEFTVKPDLLEILPNLIYHYEEPYADASALPTWYLSRMTREHVTVALTGDGGDENFAGYERFLGMKLYRSLKNWPAKTLLSSLSRLAFRLTGNKKTELATRLFAASRLSEIDAYISIISYLKPGLKKALFSDDLKKLIHDTDSKNHIEKYQAAAMRFDWLDRLLYTGIKTYLPDDLLVKSDIASMANSLEVRSPFLDHEFLELTAKMPSDLKLKGYTKKYLLKKIAADYLPAQCINRPKQGFTVPLDHWFRGPLNGYLKTTLLDKKFFAYGFREPAINRLIHEHSAVRANRENELYTLLCLRIWLKRWFE